MLEFLSWQHEGCYMFKSLNFAKKKQVMVGGVIKHLGLTDWWLHDLTSDDRETILRRYNSTGLIEGNIVRWDERPLHFIWGLADWFNKKDLRHIAYKIIAKGESMIDESSDVLDVHFLYHQKIKITYSDRNSSPEAMVLAMRACQQQIEVAHRAIESFKLQSPYVNHLYLPSHTGYSQLINILEKQNRHQYVDFLCKKAMRQGWF